MNLFHSLDLKLLILHIRAQEIFNRFCFHGKSSLFFHPFPQLKRKYENEAKWINYWILNLFYFQIFLKWRTGSKICRNLGNILDLDTEFNIYRILTCIFFCNSTVEPEAGLLYKSYICLYVSFKVKTWTDLTVYVYF